MNAADDIERSIAELNLTTKVSTDKRILDDAFSALRDGLQTQRIRSRDGLWQAILTSRMAKPLAAAAVILVALALLLSIPTRTGTIKGMYASLEEVENICVSTFQAGKTEPYQQVWTSQALKVRLFKAGSGRQAQFALWDGPNKVKMTMYLSSVQTERLTDEMLTDLEKSVSPARDVVPFADLGDIPQDAQWKRVEAPEVTGAVPGAKAYDLIWTQAGGTSGTAGHKMWRFFLDARSGLPRRAEHYAKSTSEEQYAFQTFAVFSYPTESEIRDLIRNTFGPPESRYDNPEPIGTPGAYR